MQSREDTTDEMEYGLEPVSDSQSTATQEAPESKVYTAEEEALVEERLKNLGYL